VFEAEKRYPLFLNMLQGSAKADPCGIILVFDLAAPRLLCDWTAMEHWQGI